MKAHATRDRDGRISDVKLSSSPFLTFGYRPNITPVNVMRAGLTLKEKEMQVNFCDGALGIEGIGDESRRKAL